MTRKSRLACLVTLLCTVSNTEVSASENTAITAVVARDTSSETPARIRISARWVGSPLSGR